jgi:hypothetical protein
MMANMQYFERRKHEILNIRFSATLTQAVVSATPESRTTRLAL